jgi:hypothetical protein
VSGAVRAVGACGTGVNYTVSGTYAPGPGSTGTAVLSTTSPPSTQFDQCGLPFAIQWTATVAFSSCSTGLAQEVTVIPTFNQYFQQTGTTTKTGNGTFLLTTTPVTFTVSPAPQIFMSTGDQVAITTSASTSYPISATYLQSLASNPNSACAVSLAIPDGNGTGSATSTMSAAPAGCSGVFTVFAAAGATTTTNLTQVVVPPQILLQMMYGEAHGQAAMYGAADPSEQAVGVAARNRFGDTQYFSGSTTYQNAITLSQFNGINTSITTGTVPELANAAAVFGGTSAVSVANAKCFFSPTAAGWALIQAALNSGTTVLPVAAKDPKCYRANRQFVYKQSISANVNGSGAPAFIFEQWRSPTAPAAIQIP